MLMLIRQFQFTNISDEELDLIEDFCEWLCQQMFSYINTKINRRKIQLRINYLYKVHWINWNKTSYIDVDSIMKAIEESFSYEEYRNNIWKIQTNSKILIPGTSTLMDRLIRFLDFGDSVHLGTGIFSSIKKYYDAKKLNQMWKIFITHHLGTMISDVKIITD